MKFIVAMSLAAMAVADHLKLDFTLKNPLLGDDESSDFGKSEFDVRCDGGVWQFHVDMDAAEHGNAQVYERGAPIFFTLDKVGFDKQFGCDPEGEFCAGISEHRKGELDY